MNGKLAKVYQFPKRPKQSSHLKLAARIILTILVAEFILIGLMLWLM